MFIFLLMLELEKTLVNSCPNQIQKWQLRVARTYTLGFNKTNCQLNVKCQD